MCHYTLPNGNILHNYSTIAQLRNSHWYNFSWGSLRFHWWVCVCAHAQCYYMYSHGHTEGFCHKDLWVFLLKPHCPLLCSLSWQLLICSLSLQFVVSRVLHKRDHMPCNLLILALFTQHNSLERFIQIIKYISNLFHLIAE